MVYLFQKCKQVQGLLTPADTHPDQKLGLFLWRDRSLRRLRQFTLPSLAATRRSNLDLRVGRLKVVNGEPFNLPTLVQLLNAMSNLVRQRSRVLFCTLYIMIPIQKLKLLYQLMWRTALTQNKSDPIGCGCRSRWARLSVEEWCCSTASWDGLLSWPRHTRAKMGLKLPTFARFNLGLDILGVSRFCMLPTYCSF